MRPETVGRVCAQILTTLLLMGTVVCGVAACGTGSGWIWAAFLLLAGTYTWASYPALWWVRR